MTTRVIRTEEDRTMFVRFIEDHKLPMTATVLAGAKRSVEQNALQFALLNSIAEQRGDVTYEDVRAECKLHYGVPILRRDRPDFKAQYDSIVRPLPYAHKLELMLPPVEFPVTSLMKTPQMTEYLETIYREYSAKGFVLKEAA